MRGVTARRKGNPGRRLRTQRCWALAGWRSPGERWGLWWREMCGAWGAEDWVSQGEAGRWRCCLRASRGSRGSRSVPCRTKVPGANDHLSRHGACRGSGWKCLTCRGEGEQGPRGGPWEDPRGSLRRLQRMQREIRFVCFAVFLKQRGAPRGTWLPELSARFAWVPAVDPGAGFICTPLSPGLADAQLPEPSRSWPVPRTPFQVPNTCPLPA